MIIRNNKTTSALYKGTKEIIKRYKGTLVVYETFKNLIANGVPPLTLTKCKGVDLVDYKLYGNSVQKLLPQEYQKVEYIESTGTQWIDTGYIPKINTTVIFEYGSVGKVADDNMWFGHKNGNGTNFWIESYAGTNYYSLGSTEYVKMDSVIPNSILKFSKNGIFINGIKKSEVTVTGELSTDLTCYLFARNNQNTADYPSAIQCKSFKCYEDDKIVLNLVPCYRKEDNVIGLYDLVENNFYTNAGTGNFLKGANIIPTPSPEAPIEVESVGEYDETTGKYKIPVKVSGKNFLIETLYRKMHSTDGITCEYEGNGIFHIYGEHTAGSSTSYFYLSNFPMPVPLIGNEYYTYSAKLIEGTTTHNIVPYLGTKSDTVATKNWLAVSITPNTAIGETFAKTLKANYYLADANSISNMWFYVNCPANETFVVDCRIQVWLEKSQVSSDYEPYVEPIITDIYLNEPLRKIGDYADYIDFANNKVMRKIYEYAFKGTEQVYVHPTDTKYAISVPKAGVVDIAPLSNYYQGSNGWWSGLKNGFISLNTTGGTTAGINNSNYTTEEILRTSLTDLYAQGQPLTVTYALATPTEETIELPNIPTIKGTTILEADTKVQPSYLEVVYKGKGKLENLDIETNNILNSILATTGDTKIDITNTEINEILDKIIGG